MKVMIISDTLRMGGAERAVTHLGSLFHKNGHDVIVVTVRSKAYDFFQLTEGVMRVDLGLDLHAANLLDTTANILRRTVRIRQTILKHQPDITLSFLARVSIPTIIANLGTGRPLIVTIRNYPTKEGPILRTLGKLLYRFASGVVSVSSGVDRYWANYIPRHKRFVVNNAAPQLTERDFSGESHLPRVDTQNIIAMGRLNDGKNFDVLTEAFAKLAAVHPNWTLNIIGDGPHRDRIEDIVMREGLQDRVFLLGRIQQPFPTLRAGNLFVVSSRIEGVPNVALEAMACGLPIVTTDYLGEPRDIIIDGENGLIVPRDDVDGLAAGIDRLIRDENLRHALATSAEQTARRLNPEKFYRDWLAVFKTVLERELPARR